MTAAKTTTHGCCFGFGAPLRVNPQGGPLSIARDGMISQDGAQIGAIGLFRFEPGTMFERAGSVGFSADREPEPVLGFGEASLTQFFTEGSNIDPLAELARLISVSRAFETAQNALRASEDSAQAGLRALSPSG